MVANYGPEIKAAMRGPSKQGPQKRPQLRSGSSVDSPADMARDRARGIKEGSPQDEAIDAQQGGPTPPAPAMGGTAMPTHPPAPGGGPNPAHAMMAASIAHAILGGRGGQ